MRPDELRRILEGLEKGKNTVVATVVSAQGSIPSSVGSRMLVFSDSIEGTVGGGALEQRVIADARQMMSVPDERCLVTFTSEDLDMNCGGSVTIFFETMNAGPALWIFGGGHIAKALVPMTAACGFSVTVVDNRPEFAVRERFPDAVSVRGGAYDENARMVPEGGFVLMITHGHEHDDEVLNEVVRVDPPLPYIGMIGSRNKVKLALENLRKNGVDPGSNIYAPVGLDIGGRRPGEIAVAIAAEIQGIRYQKNNLAHYRDSVS